jgi:ketosteroid isomerase-like protein
MAATATAMSRSCHAAGTAAPRFDEFHRSDDYLAALGKLSAIVKGTDNLQIVADGEHVAAFYVLVTNTPAGASPTAELHTVRGGKIRQIQVYFDRDRSRRCSPRSSTAGAGRAEAPLKNPLPSRGA